MKQAKSGLNDLNDSGSAQDLTVAKKNPISIISDGGERLSTRKEMQEKSLGSLARHTGSVLIEPDRSMFKRKNSLVG